jgi:hypothetical protein
MLGKKKVQQDNEKKLKDEINKDVNGQMSNNKGKDANNEKNRNKSKSLLGQFYTTNYQYILKNMKIPDGITTIIEPFAGQGDLLNFLGTNHSYDIECYDIEPRQEFIIQRDTLRNPPSYDDKFVLTNPPYLARNKSQNKELYDKYKCNDLYKCFIITLINSKPLGGIIIIPLNFICSVRKCDVELRKKFVEKYDIVKINIFEERVFNDTSYTVCSIIFIKRETNEEKSIDVSIFPSDTSLNVSFNKDNNYTIGGEIYNLPSTENYKIQRATRETKGDISNILLKCIDDSQTNKLGLKIVLDKDRYIDNTDKLSARSYASLIITPKLPLDKQKILVDKFNEFMTEKRTEFKSLFLTNYRESNTIARKRISFDLAFSICNYLLRDLMESHT